MKLLYVRAEGCGVCHVKAPVAEAVAREAGLPLERLDLGEETDRKAAEALRIDRVPTLALVDGERVRFRLVGTMIDPDVALPLVERARASARSGRG